MSSAARLLSTLCLAAVMVACAWYRPVAAVQLRLDDVLERLEAYLTAYEARLASLVAEEHYEQWTTTDPGQPPTSRRTLTSDFGFLRLPGRPEWLGLRDTFAVDGQSIPDREGRLERLLADGSGTRQDLARRIVEENIRYNLGVVARTVNVPMLALDLLGRRHQRRLSFRKDGDDRVAGRHAWVVRFEERERPTVVKTPRGHDRPVRGAVWLDPIDGAVLRTHLDFPAGADDVAAARVTVLYRRDEALDLLVPAEMRESYRTAAGPGGPVELGAVARYSNFRAFRSDARIVPAR
jgi:hypothetical protein